MRSTTRRVGIASDLIVTGILSGFLPKHLILTVVFKGFLPKYIVLTGVLQNFLSWYLVLTGILGGSLRRLCLSIGLGQCRLIPFQIIRSPNALILSSIRFRICFCSRNVLFITKSTESFSFSSTFKNFSCSVFVLLLPNLNTIALILSRPGFV